MQIGMDSQKWLYLVSVYRLAAAETEMVVFMTVRIHHPAPVPEWCSPSAPIRVGIVRIEDEPAALHFRIAELSAAAARHLAFVEGQVHMFSRISMEIVNAQFTDAVRKTS